MNDILFKNLLMENLTIPSTPSTINVQQTTKTNSYKCKICGASARYSYYGSISCESCKMFFKRNAETKQIVLKCHFDSKCDINRNNRHTCSSCRLKKCVAIGMRPEMIRSSRSKKNKEIQKKKSTTHSIPSISTTSLAQSNQNQPAQIPVLNLLRSDQSTLSKDQWNLLSNIVHSFDEHSGYSSVQLFIEEQNALPPRLRFRCTSVKEFFTSIMAKIQLVFGQNRDLLLLCLHDRITLLRTTTEHTTSVGGMLTLRQHHLFDYPFFYNSAEIIFGSTAAAFTRRVINQLDPDDTLIKIILAIVAVSTTNFTAYTKFDLTNLTNVKAILSIQNVYIELVWQYILYKYGYHQAVIRLSNLVRCLLLVTETIAEAHESKHFTQIIDSVIEQTNRTLCL